jgi:hypothetical protein
MSTGCRHCQTAGPVDAMVSVVVIAVSMSMQGVN